jgi:hypothetical protein
MSQMEPDYAARMLKRVLELQATGATWTDIGIALKIRAASPAEAGKIAHKRAKEAARVSQRVLLEQGIGFG